MVVLAETSQKFVEQHHFAAIHDETFENLILAGSYFRAVKNIGVVSSLLQLHR